MSAPVHDRDGTLSASELAAASKIVLLPDITEREGAFAFLIGSILNQNVSGRQAWLGAHRLVDRGVRSAADIYDRGRSPILAAIQEPPVVHPFTRPMANAIWSAAATVVTCYGDDARLVWHTATSREELQQRLVAFRQIGAHKAQVAIYLLAEVYSVVPREYGFINHIRTLCPSVVDMLSGGSWAIRRPEDAGTAERELR